MTKSINNHDYIYELDKVKEKLHTELRALKELKDSNIYPSRPRYSIDKGMVLKRLEEMGEEWIIRDITTSEAWDDSTEDRRFRIENDGYSSQADSIKRNIDIIERWLKEAEFFAENVTHLDRNKIENIYTFLIKGACNENYGLTNDELEQELEEAIDKFKSGITLMYYSRYGIRTSYFGIEKKTDKNSSEEESPKSIPVKTESYSQKEDTQETNTSSSIFSTSMVSALFGALVGAALALIFL